MNTFTNSPRNEDLVLTKATLRAASALALDDATLAQSLEISDTAIAELHQGSKQLTVDSAVGCRAQLLCRLWIALSQQVGGEEATAKDWLHTHNQAFGATPLSLVQTQDGLQRITDWLEQSTC